MSQDMVRKLKTDHHVRYEDLPLESDKGRHREVEVVANLYDENGRAIIQCNIRDITDRKLAEATALQNSRLFSTLIEQAPSGVYVIDAAFRVLQVNRLAAPVFASVSPLHGRDFNEVLDIVWGADVGRELARIFRHTLGNGRAIPSSNVHRRPRRHRRQQSYEWEAQRVTLADASYGVVCYFNDITARRHAEDVVAEREAHVRSILDNTQAFIGLLERRWTLLEANIPALKAAGDHARARHRPQALGHGLVVAGSSRGGTPEGCRRARPPTARSCATTWWCALVATTRMDIDFMLAPVRDAERRGDVARAVGHRHHRAQTVRCSKSSC